ncbi:hypothetical protein [Methylomonas fluvii]|nr:hypothetical protein [Methylomonas fluvii]
MKPIIESLFPPQIIFQFHHDTPYYREQAVFFWFRYGVWERAWLAMGFATLYPSYETEANTAPH